jgi:hypothetical protein
MTERPFRCSVCGPGRGMMARDIPIFGDESRTAVVLVICRYCGGHSPTFIDESHPPIHFTIAIRGFEVVPDWVDREHNDRR